MSKDSRSILRRITDRLYGGLNMSWPAVIIFAVITAAVTAVFLIVPAFQNTSFYNMGVTLEAWIFFAVILMANCKTPAESALKTFVFFLISQPLIYLFQVPFASMGWGLFRYYTHWLILTFCTLPAAYAGWYIRKKNWLSLLILLPVIVLLASMSVPSFRHAFRHFPNQLLTALFCIGQCLLYLYVFVSERILKIAGLAVCAAAFAFMMMKPEVALDFSTFLPDDPVLSEEADALSDDTDIAQVSISRTGTDSMVQIQAHKYGTTGFTIYDGENEYRYSMEIYEDENGYPQVNITEKR